MPFLNLSFFFLFSLSFSPLLSFSCNLFCVPPTFALLLISPFCYFLYLRIFHLSFSCEVVFSPYRLHVVLLSYSLIALSFAIFYSPFLFIFLILLYTPLFISLCFYFLFSLFLSSLSLIIFLLVYFLSLAPSQLGSRIIRLNSHVNEYTHHPQMRGQPFLSYLYLLFCLSCKPNLCLHFWLAYKLHECLLFCCLSNWQNSELNNLEKVGIP